MEKMQKVIEAEIEKIPRHMASLALKEKLGKHGVLDEAATEAFVDHVLSGQEGVFEWSDGDGACNKTVTVEFTKQDGIELLEAMNEFLNDDLPRVIESSIDNGAQNLIDALDESWLDFKRNEKAAVKHFNDRIDLRWSKGLDPLRMMLIASRELGQEFADNMTEPQQVEGEDKRKVLSLLHARACQTTHEILTLVENGLSDGAYARWRTLYEITVVAFFISQSDDELAKRYVAHMAVSARDELENSYKSAGLIYDPSSLSEAEKEIEDNFQNVVGLFGKSFKGGYGWAADCLDRKSPQFGDLENAISWGKLPPDYKCASFKVHAGVAGILRTFCAPFGELVALAGASNAGLQVPAIRTAHSLLQISSLILPKSDDFEHAVQAKALIILRDRVETECLCAAQKLEKDELKARTFSR